MDVRVLRYFLTVAREESFSRAAAALYVSQPTLSRQIKELEEELGVSLFIRDSHSVRLTTDGMRLRKRAREIVDLMDKTRAEFSDLDAEISGDLNIGGGETQAMRRVAQVAVAVRQAYPGIRYHLFSGNADDVCERLDKGLLDFGLLIEPADTRRYDVLRLPGQDTWGALMPRDHPLSQLARVTPPDLKGVPLLVSRQSMAAGALRDWLGPNADQYAVAATYNLVFNAAMMVEQGLGCALCLDHLVNTMDHAPLCFRPLDPPLTVGLHLAWKKYQVLSPAAEAFLRAMRSAFAPAADAPRPPHSALISPR